MAEKIVTKDDLQESKQEIITLHIMTTGLLLACIIFLIFLTENKHDQTIEILTQFKKLNPDQFKPDIANQDMITFDYELSSGTLKPRDHFEFWECIGIQQSVPTGTNEEYFDFCLKFNKIDKEKVVAADLLISIVKNVDTIIVPRNR